MRGRSITNDSAVLSLFQSINNMHPQLLELLNQLDERRRTWELRGHASWQGAGGCRGFPQRQGFGIPMTQPLRRETGAACRGGPSALPREGP